MAKPRPPAERDQRILRRREAFQLKARRHDPAPVAGENARYDWLQCVARSELPSTARLVAHTLCLHGQADGGNIYPGIKTIAKEAGLSETAVVKHIETLACAAFLRPYFIAGRGGQSHARTIYKLTLPRVLFVGIKSKPWEDDPTWRPRGTQPSEVPVTDEADENGTQPNGVPSPPDASRVVEATQPGEQGTQPRCEGTQPREEKALNGVESSLPLLVSHSVSQGSVLAHRAQEGLKPDPKEFAEQRQRELAAIRARGAA